MIALVLTDCFSLKATPSSMKTLNSCTVRLTKNGSIACMTAMTPNTFVSNTAYTSSGGATPLAANRQVSSSMRVQVAKRGGRTSNLTVEHCGKVSGTAKACFCTDLVNTQRRFLDEKVLRKRNPPSQNVGMNRHANRLSKCTFQVSCADPGELGQLPPVSYTHLPSPRDS